MEVGVLLMPHHWLQLSEWMLAFYLGGHVCSIMLYSILSCIILKMLSKRDRGLIEEECSSREAMMVIRRITWTACKFLSTVCFRVFLFCLFPFFNLFSFKIFTAKPVMWIKVFNNLKWRGFASFYFNINWRCTIVQRQVGWIWQKTILPISGYLEV